MDAKIVFGVNFVTSLVITTDFHTIIQIDFSHDDTKIIACGCNPNSDLNKKGLKIYDISSSNMIAEILTDTNPTSCKFAPNGQFAVSTMGGSIKTYYANFTERWVFNAPSTVEIT